MRRELTRREAIAAGICGGAAWYTAGLQSALALPRRTPARLNDIEHVIFLIQENRSFDHLFGSYRGVKGFADPRALKQRGARGLPIFAQPGYSAPGFGEYLYPFRLDVRDGGECVHDITHEWGAQHRSWNGGRMDGFVREHVAAEGAGNGAVTMGHYTRADLPYLYALADAFTVCDAYHCSVLGPSDPNHVHIVSGTLDPDGRRGGPLVGNRSSASPALSWTTMPEQLRASGVTWKVYSPETGYNPLITDSPFPMFKQYFSHAELNARGLKPRFPADFQADVEAGRLPQVSWVYANITDSDHAPFSVRAGQFTIDGILRRLAANPRLWAKTVLFVTWDENGGFFDHVAPIVPPAGTKGEFLTGARLPSAAGRIRGPVGLGFRVPLLVISPFTRGGLVCSERFDHTSLLRFLERRFGAEVPNLSAWRRSVTGDLTTAFNFAARPNPVPPRLPTASMPAGTVLCGLELREKLTGAPVAPVYRVPPNHHPGQEPGHPRRPRGVARPRRPSRA